MVRNKGKKLDSYIADYVVFDLETTGINPNSDVIIEISAVKVEKNSMVDQFSTLVNPRRKIPKAATAVNGITDEMVKDALFLSDAMERFMSFIGDCVLVGHNIHTFDTNFAYDAAKEELGKELRNDYVDTLYMARKCLPKLPKHRLVDVAEYFNIETVGAHRALNDCIMNQQCYEQLGKILKNPPVMEKRGEQICPICGAELILRKGKFGAFFGCGGYPVCRFTRNA